MYVSVLNLHLFYDVRFHVSRTTLDFVEYSTKRRNKDQSLSYSINLNMNRYFIITILTFHICCKDNSLLCLLD